ncbi:MAG: hypothetical protein LBG58_08375 [Planctomycetaceae bacterium]|nr:hypothetical protein [Planctomycetaceae bacterium]
MMRDSLLLKHKIHETDENNSSKIFRVFRVKKIVIVQWNLQSLPKMTLLEIPNELFWFLF